MGANAQTAVPAFTAGQVLTAAQQTQINTGIPVFATTVTRDAAFDGTGEKTLAEGQFAYIEATNTTQYYDGAAWQSVGSSALTFIKSQAIVAGSTTFTMSSAFSATYENYLITAQNLVISGAGNQIRIKINGTSGSTYSSSLVYVEYASATVNGQVEAAQSNGISFYAATTASVQFACNIYSPFLSKATTFFGTHVNTAGVTNFGGIDTNAASSTAFTLTMASNTFTSGDVRIYGIATSQENYDKISSANR